MLKRSVKRPRIEDSDRIFWIMLRRTLKEWRNALLVIVKPETVVRRHRRGFGYCWKRKSRSKPGRPPRGTDVTYLIKRMSTENAPWGAPRIADEFALLGHVVAASTVAKYTFPGDGWVPRFLMRDRDKCYNASRPHQGLGGNAPTPRRVEAVGQAMTTPVLSGLHNRYTRGA